MGIKAIAQTKYFVSDLDAAIRFYRETLGLKEIINVPGWAQYSAPDGGKIAILKGAEPTHVSFDVTGLAGFLDQLRGQGVNILEPYTKAEYGDHAIITDPAGNPIYLIDLATSKFPH